MYKEAEAILDNEELDLEKDLKDFNKLKDGKKHFVKMLAFLLPVMEL